MAKNCFRFFSGNSVKMGVPPLPVVVVLVHGPENRSVVPPCKMFSQPGRLLGVGRIYS